MKTDFIKPQKWRARMAARWRTIRHGLRPALISYGQQGLTLTVFFANGAVYNASLNWSEVDKVVVYLRDAVSVDLLCMRFIAVDGGIEVNEEMEGWRNLMHDLPTYLPGTPSAADWWDKAVHPPFASKSTVLFSRGN